LIGQLGGTKNSRHMPASKRARARDEEFASSTYVLSAWLCASISDRRRLIERE